MKIAAGWLLERRGTALGVVVGALTLGSAAPHLLAAFACCQARGGRCSLQPRAWPSPAPRSSRSSVRDGPHVTTTAPFDPRAARDLIRIPRARLATLGYLGHMWELYAMWAWIGAYAAAAAAAQGAQEAGAGRWGSIVAFIAVASGAPACVAAGLWADRIGKARIAGAAMIGSATCALATPLVYSASASG